MVINTIKENLRINKKIINKKEIFFEEGEVIVPDAKPDVFNIICTSGVASIYKKEILNEKIKIDGSINAYIMYMTDDGQEKIRGINANLDLSEIINIPNITNEMSTRIDTSIKEIEAKIVNERKILVKATIELNIEVYSQEDVLIVNDLENSDDIKILQEQLSVNSLVGNGETKIYAKENLSIDNADNLVEILKMNVDIGNKDIKISYNKVLTKAEARVKILYLTEDNRINKVESTVPIIGFIDIPDINERNICDTNYEIRNIILKPNSVEEHSIYFEMEVHVDTIVYEEKDINIIQDLYSPTQNIEFNKMTIKTITGKKEICDIKDINEKIKIEEIQGRKIADIDVVINIMNNNENEEKTNLYGEVELSFIIVGDDLQVLIKKEKIPFEFDISSISNNNVDTKIEIVHQDFIISEGGEVGINIQMKIDTMTDKDVSINTIDEIEANGEREEQDYSVIMYIVKSGDSLWKIAKIFGSTVEDIVRVNGIKDENVISSGQKLFIPRYKRKGVSTSQAPMINYV